MLIVVALIVPLQTRSAPGWAGAGVVCVRACVRVWRACVRACVAVCAECCCGHPIIVKWDLIRMLISHSSTSQMMLLFLAILSE